MLMHLRTFDLDEKPILGSIAEAKTNKTLAKEEYDNDTNTSTDNELSRATFELERFQAFLRGVFYKISESRSKDNGVIYEKASQIANVKRIQP